MNCIFPRAGRARDIFLFLTLCLVLAGGARAQTTGAGTITGTLTDPNGASVPGATIIVHNVDTGIDLRLASNDAGVYTAQFLMPGRYEVTVSKPGFARVVRQNLTVQVGQIVTADFSMPLQSATETVTVNAEQSVIDPEKIEMSQVISQTQQENLPLVGRRWESFALLTPNTTNDGSNGLVSYRGISGLYNNSTVDGVDNSQAFFSETKGRTTIPYIYSMDSIQEFQVSSSNYSAELGQSAGGVVNAVTKSGTNAIHADLFYYLRYTTWNALDPLQKSRGIYTQPIHQQQQFGGSVGGPILKDKLFYFFTYDGFRKVNPISFTSTSSFPLACVYSQISAAQCAAANHYLSSLLGAYPRFTNQDTGFGKIDYQMNPKNHLDLSFNLDNFFAPNSYNTAITSNNNSNTANGTAHTHERILVASFDSVINPATLNNVRAQWSQDLEVIGNNDTGPSVTVTNVMAYGMPNALPRPAFPNERRTELSDVFSKTIGTHTLKFGADVNIIDEIAINLFQGGGVYTYSGAAATAFSNWTADVMGINLGDGLTGRHFSTFVQVTDPVTGVGKDAYFQKDAAGFVEDTWKITPRLTLNLGLRYDVFLIPPPPKPNTSTPLTTLYTSTINIDKHQFAPRLGGAWQMSKGTVLRVGYGMFYAKTSNSTYYATRVENGEFQQTYNCTVTTCPALSFPNLIFNPPGGAPVAPFAGALTPVVTPISLGANTATTRGQSPDWVNPLAHEGEVTVEHQLPGNVSVSASYILSRALHLPVFIDANLGPSTQTRTYTYPDGGTFTVPFYTAANRLNNTGPILAGYSVVNSLYNSMVLSFHKRMSRGIEFVFNYTLSRAEDDGQVAGAFGTFDGTDYTIDPHNQKAMWGLSDLNQTHRVASSVVWKPGYAKNLSNSTARLLADGWTLSGIFVAASGQPVTGLISGTPAGAVDGGLTGGMVNNSGTAPSTYEDPRVPRNHYQGPGFWDIDMRLARDFTIADRFRLTLLGEAFNILNHTNVFAVNTTQYSLSGATLAPVSTFLSPSATNSGLYGARQLQISGRITF
jgi:hypothetical protein